MLMVKTFLVLMVLQAASKQKMTFLMEFLRPAEKTQFHSRLVQGASCKLILKFATLLVSAQRKYFLFFLSLSSTLLILFVPSSGTPGFVRYTLSKKKNLLRVQTPHHLHFRPVSCEAFDLPSPDFNILATFQMERNGIRWRGLTKLNNSWTQ